MDREGKLDSRKKKTEQYGFSVQQHSSKHEARFSVQQHSSKHEARFSVQQHSSKHEARFTSELYNTSIIWFKYKCTKVWKVHQRAVRKLKQPIFVNKDMQVPCIENLLYTLNLEVVHKKNFALYG